MFIYGLAWTLVWSAVGLYVWRTTSGKSRDRKLRPLAYVCFGVAAVPVAIMIAYYVSFLILPILFPGRFGGDFTAF